MSALKYSSEKPRVSGWYWYREGDWDAGQCVQVTHQDANPPGFFACADLYGHKTFQRVEKFAGEFSGPIERPAS